MSDSETSTAGGAPVGCEPAGQGWDRLSWREIAVLGVGFLFYFQCAVPGNLGVDGNLHLCFGRAWIFRDWHPPFNAVVMSLGDWIVPGPFFYFFLCYTGLLCGVILLVPRMLPRRSWVRTGLLVVLAFNPAIHGLLVEIFKDNLQTAFVLVALGLLFRAESHKSIWLTGLGLLCLDAAAWTRHNAVLLLPIIVVYWWLSTKQLAKLRKAALVGAMALLFFAPNLLTMETKEYPVQQLFTWDIWGMSKRLQEPHYLESHPGLKGRHLNKILESWHNDETNTSLIFHQRYGETIRTTDKSRVWEIGKVWLDVVSSNPLEYLKMRTNYWLYLMKFKSPSIEPDVVGLPYAFGCEFKQEGGCVDRNCLEDDGVLSWPGRQLRFDRGHDFLTSVYNSNRNAWWMSGFLCCLIVLMAGILVLILRERVNVLLPSLFVCLAATELLSLMFIGTASTRRYYSLSYVLCHFLLAWSVLQAVAWYQARRQAS